VPAAARHNRKYARHRASETPAYALALKAVNSKSNTCTFCDKCEKDNREHIETSCNHAPTRAGLNARDALCAEAIARTGPCQVKNTTIPTRSNSYTPNPQTAPQRAYNKPLPIASQSPSTQQQYAPSSKRSTSRKNTVKYLNPCSQPATPQMATHFTTTEQAVETADATETKRRFKDSKVTSEPQSVTTSQT
jgi:hypothetical protein